MTKHGTGARKGNSLFPASAGDAAAINRQAQTTLDNRRLEAFRRAEMDVPYRMATPQEAAREGWKFTTRNDGVTIRIRGE